MSRLIFSFLKSSFGEKKNERVGLNLGVVEVRLRFHTVSLKNEYSPSPLHFKYLKTKNLFSNKKNLKFF